MITLASNLLVSNQNTLTGAASFFAGRLNLVTFSLNCATFSATGTPTKTIDFGTSGAINCKTSYTTANSTGLYTVGTPVVNVNPGINSDPITLSPGATATYVNFNITNGSGTLTLTANNVFNNINLTGFKGTLAATTIYVQGNLTIPATVTIATSSTALLYLDNFQTFESEINIGAVVNRNVSILGGVKLISALTLGWTNGTLTFPAAGASIGINFNNYTLTCLKFNALAPGALSFNGGSLICTGSTTTTFNSNGWYIVTSGGTQTGTISMTGAAPKTFAGGNNIYYATLNQGGSGHLNIVDNNTFNDLTCTQPSAFIILDWGTIQTFLNAFSLSGSPPSNYTNLISNLVGSRATISKASGVISTSYLSIKDIEATGGAAWYAPPSQGNVDAGGNIGWSFTLPPVLVDLASNSYATSSLVGAIYGKAAISSTVLTTASASANVNLLQSLDSVSTCYAFSAGNINSTLGLISDASALPLLTGDIYSTIEISSTALSTAIANGTVSVASDLFYYYADADYAVDGYFLTDEAPLSSSSQVASFSAGSIDFNAFLFSNAAVINNVVGDIDLSQALTTTAQVTSTVLGNINSTLPISASAFAPTQAAASIYLDMYISGQPTAQSTCLGGVDLTQTLLSNAQISPLLTGSIFSTLLVSSNSQVNVDVSARLTFPSLYIGILSLTSITPINTKASLTPIYNTLSITPIRSIVTQT